MSNIESTGDPYMEHPLAPVFVEAVFEANDNTGELTLSSEKMKELSGTFGINKYQTSAHAYLASQRARQVLAVLDIMQPTTTEPHRGDN